MFFFLFEKLEVAVKRSQDEKQKMVNSKIDKDVFHNFQFSINFNKIFKRKFQNQKHDEDCRWDEEMRKDKTNR